MTGPRKLRTARLPPIRIVVTVFLGPIIIIIRPYGLLMGDTHIHNPRMSVIPKSLVGLVRRGSRDSDLVFLASGSGFEWRVALAYALGRLLSPRGSANPVGRLRRAA